MQPHELAELGRGRRKKDAQSAVHCDAREHDTRHSGQYRDHERLGEQLAHQARAARTHGEPYADFALPGQTARQQYVRHIGTAGGEYQAESHQYRREENQHHRREGHGGRPRTEFRPHIRAVCVASAASAASACALLTPSRRRPMTSTAISSLRKAACIEIGAQKSGGDSSRPANSRPATPIIS